MAISCHCSHFKPSLLFLVALPSISLSLVKRMLEFTIFFFLYPKYHKLEVLLCGRLRLNISRLTGDYCKGQHSNEVLM